MHYNSIFFFGTSKRKISFSKRARNKNKKRTIRRRRCNILFNHHRAVYCAPRNIRKLSRDFGENFDREIYFLAKSCPARVVYATSIDYAPHARNTQWSLRAKSFRSFTRNFLVYGRGWYPGLWSESEQSSGRKTFGDSPTGIFGMHAGLLCIYAAYHSALDLKAINVQLKSEVFRQKRRNVEKKKEKINK